MITTRDIQAALKARGLDPGPVDGIMGDRTRAAVRAFQKAAGLSADGLVGEKTRAALFPEKPASEPGKPAAGHSAIEITPDLLRKIAPRGNAGILAGVAQALTTYMPLYEVNTPLRAAHLLAQLSHESDGFATLEEYASGAAYEGRKDLGNTEPGDGRRYKGRGPIQCTGRANYARYGAKLGLPLVEHPEMAADPDVGVRIALEFWRDHGLNALADRGDARGITKRINGGTNGLDDRIRYLGRAKQALGI